MERINPKAELQVFIFNLNTLEVESKEVEIILDRILHFKKRLYDKVLAEIVFVFFEFVDSGIT